MCSGQVAVPSRAARCQPGPREPLAEPELGKGQLGAVVRQGAGWDAGPETVLPRQK